MAKARINLASIDIDKLNQITDSIKEIAKKTKVSVITLKHKQLPDLSKYEGIDIHRLDSQVVFPGVYEIPKLSKKNCRIIHNLVREHDVIITQTRFFSTSLLGAILSLIYTKKHIQ